jgi:hypothetical protein
MSERCPADLADPKARCQRPASPADPVVDVAAVAGHSLAGPAGHGSVGMSERCPADLADPKARCQRPASPADPVADAAVAGRRLAGPANVEAIPISREEGEREYAILRLRLAEGISARDFRERFGCDFEQKYAAPLRKLANEGLLKAEGGIDGAGGMGGMIGAGDMGGMVGANGAGSVIGANGEAMAMRAADGRDACGHRTISLTPKGLDLANRVFVEFI